MCGERKKNRYRVSRETRSSRFFHSSVFEDWKFRNYWPENVRLNTTETPGARIPRFNRFSRAADTQQSSSYLPRARGISSVTKRRNHPTVWKLKQQKTAVYNTRCFPYRRRIPFSFSSLKKREKKPLIFFFRTEPNRTRTAVDASTKNRITRTRRNKNAEPRFRIVFSLACATTT